MPASSFFPCPPPFFSFKLPPNPLKTKKKNHLLFRLTFNNPHSSPPRRPLSAVPALRLLDLLCIQSRRLTAHFPPTQGPSPQIFNSRPLRKDFRDTPLQQTVLPSRWSSPAQALLSTLQYLRLPPHSPSTFRRGPTPYSRPPASPGPEASQSCFLPTANRRSQLEREEQQKRWIKKKGERVGFRRTGVRTKLVRSLIRL